MKDSPVVQILKKTIHFEKQGETAVYHQIAHQISEAIQRKIITENTLLPGTRTLSQLLKIHRNTAVAVYDELALQGWVKIIPKKGTFASNPHQKKLKIKAKSNLVNVQNHKKIAGFQFETSFNLAFENTFSSSKYALNEGLPDVRLHPIHQFSRWYNAAMKRKSLLSKWNQTSLTRYSIFENQLCNYLNATRGFHIQPNNLISTRSSEMSLYIISQLLIRKNDIVLVGKMSNAAANKIFQQSGALLKAIPVDEEGLDIEYIEKHFTKGTIRCVYVSSNRHFPTTKTLSAARRLKLMELAKKHQFVLIEDDFDYDFQFEGTPKPPLASEDENGMVIYLGKMGQSLFPSFQSGFVVAPENIIIEAKNYLQMIDSQGDLIQEQMLSELIYEGEIHKLIQKNVLIYKQRLDYLCEVLSANFGTTIHFEKPTGGLAIWLQFEPKISLVKLSEQANQIDLFLPKTILFQDKNTCAIRFGFGNLNEEELKIVVEKLKIAYDLVIKPNNLLSLIHI